MSSHSKGCVFVMLSKGQGSELRGLVVCLCYWLKNEEQYDLGHPGEPALPPTGAAHSTGQMGHTG